MEKRTYIQPEMEVAVMPEGILMNEPLPASGGTWAATDDPADPAPKRRTPVF